MSELFPMRPRAWSAITTGSTKAAMRRGGESGPSTDGATTPTRLLRHVIAACSRLPAAQLQSATRERRTVPHATPVLDHLPSHAALRGRRSTNLPYRGPTKQTKSVPNSPELGVISMLCLEDGTRPGAQRDGKSALPDEGRRAKLWQFQLPMRTSLRVHMLRIACRRRPGGAAPRGS